MTVTNLELRLPVVEKPGSFKGLVGAPAEKFLPDGYELAADFAALPSPHPKLEAEAQGQGLEAGRQDRLPGRVRGLQRRQGRRDRARSKGSGKKQVKVAKGKLDEVAGGKSKKLKLKLTGKGRSCFATSRS